MNKAIRKKLLLPIFLLLVVGALNVGIPSVSAVPTSPYIMVDPESVINYSLGVGDTFTVDIITDYSGSDIWAWEFSLTYDPNILHGVTVVNGDLISLDKSPWATFMQGTFDNTAGKLGLTGAFLFYISPPIPTVSGPGTLATVTFEVAGYGDSDITLGDDTVLKSPTANIIDASANPEQIGDGFFSNWMGGVPPVASFTWTPVTPEVGDVVTFDASTSYDPDGTIVGYYWEFGNGETSSAMVANTTYNTIGLYTVRLTVTDNATLEDLGTATIEVISAKEGVDLAEWQARIEHRRYDLSKDEDTVNTIWALVKNTANLTDVELTIEFAITDYYTGLEEATYYITTIVPAGTDVQLETMSEWEPTVGKFMVRVTGYYDTGAGIETTKTKRITTRCVP